MVNEIVVKLLAGKGTRNRDSCHRMVVLRAIPLLKTTMLMRPVASKNAVVMSAEFDANAKIRFAPGRIVRLK